MPLSSIGLIFCCHRKIISYFICQLSITIIPTYPSVSIISASSDCRTISYLILRSKSAYRTCRGIISIKSDFAPPSRKGHVVCRDCSGIIKLITYLGNAVVPTDEGIARIGCGLKIDGIAVSLAIVIVVDGASHRVSTGDFDVVRIDLPSSNHGNIVWKRISHRIIVQLPVVIPAQKGISDPISGR